MSSRLTWPQRFACLVPLVLAGGMYAVTVHVPDLGGDPICGLKHRLQEVRVGGSEAPLGGSVDVASTEALLQTMDFDLLEERVPAHLRRAVQLTRQGSTEVLADIRAGRVKSLLDIDAVFLLAMADVFRWMDTQCR